LIYALQPYGSLIAIADLVGKASNSVNLNPLNFEAASSELGAESLDYSNKIAKLMNDRPGLRIKLCGKATGSDRQALIQQKQQAWLKQQASKKPAADTGKKKPAMPEFVIKDEALFAIASQRADKLKELLVKQHNIGAERLFLCKPEIDSADGAAPRLDINI